MVGGWYHAYFVPATPLVAPFLLASNSALSLTTPGTTAYTLPSDSAALLPLYNSLFSSSLSRSAVSTMLAIVARSPSRFGSPPPARDLMHD